MIEPLVLALGDLQIEGGTLTVNHNRPRVQQLLAGAIVRGEAAHHAEWEEEFHRLGLDPSARWIILLKSMPSKSDISWRKVIQYRRVPDEKCARRMPGPPVCSETFPAAAFRLVVMDSCK